MKRNTLYYGDCLEIMQEWPDACADLVYLDPPFNSDANYNILFGRQKSKPGTGERKDLAQMIAFSDIWEWNEETAARISAIKKARAHRARGAVAALDAFFEGGNGMLSYLVYMADRINEMHRVLKDSGSFYLHCDPTASHYLKMILDCVFGAKNFRNEIVWCYSGGGTPRQDYPRKHDTIFRYTKGNEWVFHVERKPYKENTQQVGKHSTLSGGADIDLEKGTPVTDWWTDIKTVTGWSAEKIGYHTQKPLALLERIVAASSNEGDLVLDPFCGCGTTVEAAMNLNRDFIGIDISMYALDVIQHARMKNTKFVIEGIPYEFSSAQDMARKRPFAFEKWAVHRIPGFVSNNKQTGDGGVDGWAALLYPPPGEDGVCIAQVKGGTPNVDALRAMLSKISAGFASLGVFITLKKWDTPTVRKCIVDAGQFKQGTEKYNRLVVWSIEEYFENTAPKLPARTDPRTGEAFQTNIWKS